MFKVQIISFLRMFRRKIFVKAGGGLIKMTRHNLFDSVMNRRVCTFMFGLQSRWIHNITDAKTSSYCISWHFLTQQSQSHLPQVTLYSFSKIEQIQALGNVCHPLRVSTPPFFAAQMASVMAAPAALRVPSFALPSRPPARQPAAALARSATGAVALAVAACHPMRRSTRRVLRAEGRPVSVLVEQTDRHELSGRDDGTWTFRLSQPASSYRYHLYRMIPHDIKNDHHTYLL